MMKEDTSPRVPQRKKIDFDFRIKEFNWTEKQKKFIDIALSKETNIILCKSPPGTGKTILSVFCSLFLLKKKSIGSILFLRNPVESCSHSLGFAPGLVSDKIKPYAEPLFMSLDQLLEKGTINNLLINNRIEVNSVGLIQGQTWHNMAIIQDESADLRAKDLRLIMGRLGRFSKLFIIGDEFQANIRNSDFLQVFNLFNNEESRANGIFTFEFDKNDCMRNGMMKFVLEKFETINVNKNNV